jgi:hypothetical protein
MGIVRDWFVYTGGTQGTAAETGVTLRTELGQKYQTALRETNGSHDEAELKLAKLIDLDRRFDQYPTERLVTRFRECFQNGSYLDLDDPWLKGDRLDPVV